MASNSIKLESDQVNVTGGSGINSTQLLQWSHTVSKEVEAKIAGLRLQRRNGSSSTTSKKTVSNIEDEMATFVQESTERQEAMKKKIADAEKVYEKLLKDREKKLKELKRIEDEEATEIANIDFRIDELQAEFETVNDAGHEDRVYASTFGGILTHELKLDWKTTVGEVKCPAGHVVVKSAPTKSSKSALELNNSNKQGQAHASSIASTGGGSGTEAGSCDFWNCAALNISS